MLGVMQFRSIFKFLTISGSTYIDNVPITWFPEYTSLSPQEFSEKTDTLSDVRIQCNF